MKKYLKIGLLLMLISFLGLSLVPTKKLQAQTLTKAEAIRVIPTVENSLLSLRSVLVGQQVVMMRQNALLDNRTRLLNQIGSNIIYLNNQTMTTAERQIFEGQLSVVAQIVPQIKTEVDNIKNQRLAFENALTPVVQTLSNIVKIIASAT